jgi:hypothetical protein
VTGRCFDLAAKLGLNIGKAVMAGLAPAIHAAPRRIYRQLRLPSVQRVHDETAVFS